VQGMCRGGGDMFLWYMYYTNKKQRVPYDTREVYGTKEWYDKVGYSTYMRSKQVKYSTYVCAPGCGSGFGSAWINLI